MTNNKVILLLTEYWGLPGRKNTDIMYERVLSDYLDLTGRNTEYYSGDEIKEDEMGGTCSTWRRRKLHLALW
jgi:hypothetical protein